MHNVIFKMHIFLQQLRMQDVNPIARALTTPSNVLHVVPALVFDSSPCPLVFTVDSRELDQLLENQPPPILGFADILKRCRFACNDTSGGLTWHEIFILSAAVSGDPQIFSRSTAVASKANLNPGS